MVSFGFGSSSVFVTIKLIFLSFSLENRVKHIHNTEANCLTFHLFNQFLIRGQLGERFTYLLERTLVNKGQELTGLT